METALTQEEQNSVEIVKNAWATLAEVVKLTPAIEHISTMVKIPMGRRFELHGAISLVVTNISKINIRVVPRQNCGDMLVVLNWYR